MGCTNGTWVVLQEGECEFGATSGPVPGGSGDGATQK
jgi:hypothetical protein